MRRLLQLCVFSLAIIGGGCATDPPPAAEQVRQQALGNVNLDRPWKATGSGASTDAAQITVQDNWLTTFNDPTLDALVREAIANNPDLRVAAARVEQAAQYLVIAGAGMKPAVSLFGTGGTKTGGGGDATSALQAVVLGASWELDIWGRVRYGRNAAQQDYVSAQADFEFARQSLAAATAKAWFTATQLTVASVIAAEMTATANELQSLAAQRERVGVGTDAETAIAIATARDVESTQRQTEYSRDQAVRALEVLVGRYPAAELTARAQLLALPGPVPVGVPLQMLERRPDVIAAERQVAAAFNRVGEAKAARLPQLTLSLNFGAFDSEILELREDYDNPSGGLGARLLAPIYQGGALKAQVEVRTLQQKEAVANYAKIALRALNDVENSLAASESLATRVNLLNQSVSEHTRALDLTQNRFRIGRIDRRSVEQQRLNLHNARIALLSLQTEQLAERVNLHLALGGSFELPPR